MAQKILFSFELEPGMIVAQDVFRPNGGLLFPKHTMLNELMIAKLPLYNIMELPIVDGPIEKPQIDMAHIMELALKDKQKEADKSYSERIKSSEDFREFTGNYSATVTKVTDKINSFIENPSLDDMQSLIDDTLSLMKGNSIHIFDMLHNMRTHDDSVYEHSTNVAIISATIGKWLDLPEKDINNLIVSGLLHDLGKLSIPPEILNKPKSLTDEEYQIIKTHPRNSYEAIKNLPLDIRIKEACLLHHERCDGSGYPFGISGNKISTYAKIIAIADVYDAMTSPRKYREALCPFKAIELFESEGLHKYDPKFIMTFLENIGASYIHNKVLLSDGRTGEIVMLNKLTLSRPIVKCDDEFIDLSKKLGLSIQSII